VAAALGRGHAVDGLEALDCRTERGALARSGVSGDRSEDGGVGLARRLRAGVVKRTRDAARGADDEGLVGLDVSSAWSPHGARGRVVMCRVVVLRAGTAAADGHARDLLVSSGEAAGVPLADSLVEAVHLVGRGQRQRRGQGCCHIRRRELRGGRRVRVATRLAVGVVGKWARRRWPRRRVG
jgi:hypothetical protein